MTSTMEYARWTHEPEVTDEMILTHWSKLVRFVAAKVVRSYHLGEEDIDDITSDINVKLLGIPQASRPFEGYCRTVINNAARSAIDTLLCRGGNKRTWQDFKTLDYVQATPQAPSDEPTSHLDRVVPTPDSPEGHLVDSITVDNALTSLSKNERDVIHQHYRCGLALEVIGQGLGISRQAVWLIHRKAITKLRRKFKVKLRL